jgi:TPR repeat protein
LARALFQEGAIRGDPDAMVNLAAMLIRGEGGGADPVDAWAWLTLARKGGREDVAAGLAGLEARMTPQDIAAARALVGG